MSEKQTKQKQTKARKAKISKIKNALIAASNVSKSAAAKSLIKNPAGKIAGKGSYVSDFLSALGQTANGVTKGLGAVTGGLGSLLSGFGDYRERSAKGNYVPMSIGDGAGGGPGTFIGAAAPRIRHREYIGNVYSTINFATKVYPIQIGVSALFPWLSTMADSFQQYRLHGMELYYESTSSNVSATTNTSLGTVMMSTQYEVAKSPLDSSVAILNSEFTTSEKPTENFYHPIECDPSKTTISTLYVRTSYDEQTSFTDMGNFQVSTEGMQADGVQIGKLWCTYDVEVMKPTLPTNSSLYARFTNHSLVCSTSNVNIAGATAASVVTLPTVSTFPGDVVGGVANDYLHTTTQVSGAYTNDHIFMPKDCPGQYLVTIVGSTQDAVNYYTLTGMPTLTSFFGGCTFGQVITKDYWPNLVLANEACSSAVDTFGAGSVWKFQVSAFINMTASAGAFRVQILGDAFNTSLTSLDYIICQVPPSGFSSKPLKLSEVNSNYEALKDQVAQLKRLLELKEDAPSAQETIGWTRVDRPTPLGVKDLTRFGVERNPGPSNVDTLGQYLQECKPIDLEKFLGHTSGMPTLSAVSLLRDAVQKLAGMSDTLCRDYLLSVNYKTQQTIPTSNDFPSLRK